MATVPRNARLKNLAADMFRRKRTAEELAAERQQFKNNVYASTRHLHEKTLGEGLREDGQNIKRLFGRKKGVRRSRAQNVQLIRDRLVNNYKNASQMRGAWMTLRRKMIRALGRGPNGRPYGLIIETHISKRTKSTEWLAHMVEDTLGRPAATIFDPRLSGQTPRNRLPVQYRHNSLRKAATDFVLFDDAAYSGDQAREAILQLRTRLFPPTPNASFRRTPVIIHVFLLFATRTAVQLLKASGDPHNNIHVEVHNAGLIKEHDIQSFPGWFRRRVRAEKIGNNFEGYAKTLTVLPHKVPNGQSSILTWNALGLLTNRRPAIYKPPSSPSSQSPYIF